MTRFELVSILSPVLLVVAGLVGFSCFRDAMAIRTPSPDGTPIVVPLHP